MLEHNPLHHEHVNGNQLKFIDACSKGGSEHEERKFHSVDDLGRYGL